MIKKLFFTLSLLVVCLFAKAQILYGVKISGGIGSQYINEFDITSTNIITTFNIGGVVELPTKYGFWLQSGLGIAQKGSVLHDESLTTTTHLTYLNVPVNIIKKFTFTNIGKFYIGAGAYAAYGLSGSFFYQTPSSSSTDFVQYGNNNDFRRVDAGLNFLSGFELKNKITFDLEYSVGLNNIASDPQKNAGITDVRNREFSVGIGYLF